MSWHRIALHCTARARGQLGFMRNMSSRLDLIRVMHRRQAPATAVSHLVPSDHISSDGWVRAAHVRCCGMQ
jgi:hypothetical protein